MIRSYFFRKATALRACRTDAPPFRAFVARRYFRERESKIAHAASFVNAARNTRPRAFLRGNHNAWSGLEVNGARRERAEHEKRRPAPMRSA